MRGERLSVLDKALHDNWPWLLGRYYVAGCGVSALICMSALLAVHAEISLSLHCDGLQKISEELQEYTKLDDPYKKVALVPSLR